MLLGVVSVRIKLERGQVTPSPVSIFLGKRMTAETFPEHSGIAVVGMACVFPGASSPGAFWENILAGRREFRKIPAERLPRDLYYHPDPLFPDKTYCDQAALITGWAFDPLPFRIPRVTVEVTDPTHWLALSTARVAFCDAGIDLERADRQRVAVVIGNTLGGEYGRTSYLRYRWPFVERAFRRAVAHTGEVEEPKSEALLAAMRHFYLEPLPRITEDSLAGTMSNTIAGRICNHFDIGGGGYTVDGACSSSLLAVANACDALVRGEVDMALAGGVDISLDPYELIGFAKTKALALDDIRPYDERACGMLPGEGCGLVVLVREAYARSRGLQVRAIIRGWAHSSDGKGGITAPRREGQVRALRRAYQKAGYSIGSVQLIEGHGTGTSVGDAVELSAILEVLGESPETVRCRIGSVKGNIGHCKAAAGAAGLIKAVLSLENQILPPTAGCERPHPLFGRPFRRLAPALEAEPWGTMDAPRRASVSAFGFGGSNVHLTLQEHDPHPARTRRSFAPSASQSAELILISAPDRDRLADRIEHVRRLADRISRAELPDLAFALSQIADRQELRVAVLARSPWHLQQVLADLRARLSAGQEWGLVTGTDAAASAFIGHVAAGAEQRQLAAVFPGQGSQRPGMLGHLLGRYPFVRTMCERFDAALAEIGHPGISRWTATDLRGANAGQLAAWANELRATENAQPAIVATSLATLRVLEFHGLRPNVCLGHSLGELTALSAAGACDDVTAVLLAAKRGQAMSAIGPADSGQMLAVAASPETVVALIERSGADVAISNFNSPRQTVVSGPSPSVVRLTRACHDENVPCRRLDVSHAFHSAIVAPMAAAFRDDVARVAWRERTSAVVSSVTGNLLPPNADIVELLTDQIQRPVRFVEAVRRAEQMQPTLWVEVGPGRVLLDLLRENISGTPSRVVSTDRPEEDGPAGLLTLLAQAFVLGFEVDTSRIFAHRAVRPFALDDYAPVFFASPCERAVPPPAPCDVKPIAGVVAPRVAEMEAAGDERAEALAFAIEWIAKRTGYPREAITPDLRLRDDLNLDSIKAMELIQDLESWFGDEQVSPPEGWDNLRLLELVESFIEKQASNHAAEAGDEGLLLRARPLESIDADEPWIRKFSPRLVEAPLEAEADLLPPRPSVFVAACAGCARGDAMMRTLNTAGYQPSLVEPHSLNATFERPPDLGGLIWILPDGEDWTQLAETCFYMARWLLSRPSEHAARIRWLILRTESNPTLTGPLDAGAAFLKSFRLEHPALLTKWLRMPIEWAPEESSWIASLELKREGTRVAYAYDREGRRWAEVARAEQETRAPLVLEPGEVALVTGGARGITRELATALAEHTKARIVLAGTSSPSDPEVEQGCRFFVRQGIDARYRRCDVTDSEAVRHLFQTIQNEIGPVAAILHGAGVTEPASLDRMTRDAFLRAIRVKAGGLSNLLSAQPIETLKAVHVVSSVLGYTGMARQADYCFANAWLDGALNRLAISHPSLHVLAMAYSVWRESGMGRNLGVADMLANLGVSLIDNRTGVQVYRDTLRGLGGPRVIVTGRLVPRLEEVLYATPPARHFRFAEKAVRWIPGTEAVFETSLDHQRDPYLADHVFGGTALMPAVLGMEAMAQAAATCAARDDLRTIENTRFHLPVIVSQDSSLRVRLYALVESREADGDDGPVRVKATLRCEVDGFAQDRFSATFLFGPAQPSSEVEPLEQPLPPKVAIPDGARDRLFQGPFFRRLTSVRRLEMGELCVADVAIPTNAHYFGGGEPPHLVTPFPVSRDAFLQSLLLMSDGQGLPIEVKAIHFYARPEASSVVVCRSRRTPGEPERPAFDIDVFTPEGTPVEQIRGIVIARSSRTSRPAGVELLDLPTELAAQCPHFPHALAVMTAPSVVDEHPGKAREQTSQLNLSAARRAAADFIREHRGRALSAESLRVAHREDGRPVLEGDSNWWESLQGLELSLTDSAEVSMALVGTGRLGIDFEPVNVVPLRRWQQLVGLEGLDLARHLAELTHESLAEAATRVWTMIEATMKAVGRRPPLANATVDHKGTWLQCTADARARLVLVSCLVEAGAHNPTAAVTVAFSER